MVPAEMKEVWYTREQRQAQIPGLRAARAVLAVFVLWFTWNWNKPALREYIRHCDTYAQSLSNPQLMWKAQLRLPHKLRIRQGLSVGVTVADVLAQGRLVPVPGEPQYKHSQDSACRTEARDLRLALLARVPHLFHFRRDH